MPTDPSIILSGQPAPETYQNVLAQAYKIKQMQFDQQQQQQELQSQNSLRSLLSDPTNLDPETGLPTREAVAKAYGINPATGLKLSNALATAEEDKAKATLSKSETFVKKNELVDEARSSALESYDRDLAAGIPETQARANAQSVYSEGVTGLRKSGIFSKDEADTMASAFDPVSLRANSHKYQAWKDQQDKEALAAKKEADAAKERDKTEAERERHDRELEKQAGQKINIQVGKENAPAPTLDDTGIDYAAQRYRETGVMPSLGMGKAAAGLRQIIIERAAEQAKASGGGAGADIATAAEVKAAQAGLTNLGKMKASVAQAEGNARKEADLVLSLTDKGAAGGTPVFNKWMQGARTGVFGDPDASKFQTAVESFKNEYVKVLSTQGGMSGGMSSDAARREADTYINPNLSKAQIKANIEVMRKSMENRTNAINEAYEATRKKIEDLGKGGGTNHPKTTSSGATVSNW